MCERESFLQSLHLTLDSWVSPLLLRQGHAWHTRMRPPAPEFGTKEPIKQDDFPMISRSEEIPGCRLRIKDLQTLMSKGHCGAGEAIDQKEPLRSARQSNAMSTRLGEGEFCLYKPLDTFISILRSKKLRLRKVEELAGIAEIQVSLAADLTPNPYSVTHSRNSPKPLREPPEGPKGQRPWRPLRGASWLFPLSLRTYPSRTDPKHDLQFLSFNCRLFVY